MKNSRRQSSTFRYGSWVDVFCLDDFKGDAPACRFANWMLASMAQVPKAGKLRSVDDFLMNRRAFCGLLAVTPVCSERDSLEHSKLQDDQLAKRTRFPRDDYTPFGYLDNPWHSWALHRSGVLRSIARHAGGDFNFVKKKHLRNATHAAIRHYRRVLSDSSTNLR